MIKKNAMSYDLYEKQNTLFMIVYLLEALKNDKSAEGCSKRVNRIYGEIDRIRVFLDECENETYKIERETNG